MWILLLNPMQANTEVLRPVARAEMRETLEAFLSREKVDGYSDDDGVNMCGGKLHKTFRKNGPLEYYNPPSGIHGLSFVEVSLEEDLRRTREAWDRDVMTIPLV